MYPPNFVNTIARAHQEFFFYINPLYDKRFKIPATSNINAGQDSRYIRIYERERAGSRRDLKVWPDCPINPCTFRSSVDLFCMVNGWGKTRAKAFNIPENKISRGAISYLILNLKISRFWHQLVIQLIETIYFSIYSTQQLGRMMVTCGGEVFSHPGPRRGRVEVFERRPREHICMRLARGSSEFLRRDAWFDHQGHNLDEFLIRAWGYSDPKGFDSACT